ncbi:MAG TPA: SDR family oxidoreductase [Terriglobales bacterium]|nr:SDR family oxidoreductase [Terriglobales bacterium]
MRLQGKVAIVTGAGSGIGRACAGAFVREGAKVALVARQEERLLAAASELGQDNALAIPADVANKSDIKRVVRQTGERFGTVHVLVNSAAALIAGTADSQTEEAWDETFNTNVRGLWLLSKAVIPHMRSAGGGSIINIGSVVGLIGARNRIAYGASKGAVITLTKCMAMDLGPDKIRVNAICPGIVETDLVADFINKAPDPDAARKQRLEVHPLGRFGSVNDIASAAVFLASEESSWVTGAAIPIDGGYTAGKV